MNELETQVRQVLTDLADEGRPVPLGHRALARVHRRRQRRTRAVTALAALTVGAAALARLLTSDGGPSDPAPDLTGQNVVAVFYTTADARVLNPATGRYRPTELSVETVTSDLRFAAGTRIVGYAPSYPAQEPRLGVLDIRSGELSWLPMSHEVEEPVWSPDGRYVVARVKSDKPSAVLVDPAASTTHTIGLAVPADRLLTRLCWSDKEHLLAVAVPRPDADVRTQDLLILDKSGYLVKRVSIPDDWTVSCDGRQGRVVVTRLAQPREPSPVVPPEAAIVDLTSGTVSEPVRLPWAGTITPTAWRTDRSFVAVSRDHVLVVDLDRGSVTEPRLARAPAGKHAYGMFLPADGLDRHAEEVADGAF